MKKTVFAVLSLVVITLTVAIVSCSKKTGVEPIATSSLLQKHYDTIPSLDQMHADTVIWKVYGQYVMVTHEDSHDAEAEAEEETMLKTAACSDIFAGTARATAKTSYATVSYTTYSTIAALRNALPTDATMLGLGITNSSNRVTLEKKNPTITTAYLYAISRESDNDFHMILGDTPANSTGTNLFNCEAAGLPATSASSYNTIKAVRTYLKTYFGTDFCTTTGYTKFSPPIKTTVLKGSLFFDIDHSAGTVGPSGLRPNTAWEMHPINSIHF